MQTRSVRAQLSPLFIIWPQLEGGFDGDFAGLASGSICEIEINSTRQKVETILFEFRVAGISIRTCHKWETLQRIRMRSQIHIFEMSKSLYIFSCRYFCKVSMIRWNYVDFEMNFIIHFSLQLNGKYMCLYKNISIRVWGIFRYSTIFEYICLYHICIFRYVFVLLFWYKFIQIFICIIFYTNLFEKKPILCAKKFKSKLAQIFHTHINIQRKITFPVLCQLCFNFLLNKKN